LNEHYSHWLPKLLNVTGITIMNHIFYAIPKKDVSDKIRKHEAQHVNQYKEDGVIFFFLRYFYEYFKNRLKGQSRFEAYQNISYEVEARKAEKL